MLYQSVNAAWEHRRGDIADFILVVKHPLYEHDSVLTILNATTKSD